jgi:hypothetical protein
MRAAGAEGREGKRGQARSRLHAPRRRPTRPSRAIPRTVQVEPIFGRVSHIIRGRRDAGQRHLGERPQGDRGPPRLRPLVPPRAKRGEMAGEYRPGGPMDTTPEPSTIDPDALDRARGALLGLAVGDAVGTTVEFMPRGSFPPSPTWSGAAPSASRPGSGPTTPPWPCASPRACSPTPACRPATSWTASTAGRPRATTPPRAAASTSDTRPSPRSSATGAPATPSPATRAPARPGTARSCGWRRSRSGGGATPTRPRRSPAGRA